MKVIKNSLLIEKKPVHIQCDHCFSELEVTPTDVKSTIADRDGKAHVFNCAVCFRDIYINVIHINW